MRRRALFRTDSWLALSCELSPVLASEAELNALLRLSARAVEAAGATVRSIGPAETA